MSSKASQPIYSVLSPDLGYQVDRSAGSDDQFLQHNFNVAQHGDDTRLFAPSESYTEVNTLDQQASVHQLEDNDVPQETAASTQLLKDNKAARQSAMLTRWFTDWWSLEIISIVCSALSFVAMIGVLSSYDGLPLDEWSAPVTINTAISLFSTLSKSTILLAVSACIGQLKWQHFARNTRRLADLQTFDEASRGPWGACDLLIRSTSGSILAMFAASIVVLALAVDPFAQQVVAFPLKQISVANESATILKAQSYDTGASAAGGSFTAAYASTQMQGAIFRGIFNLRSDNMFSCPSADCDYPPFATLEMCSTCSEITKNTKRACYKYPNGTASPPRPAEQVRQTAPMSCKYTLPQGDNFWAHSSMSGQGSYNTLVNATATAGNLNAGSFSRMTILRLPELISFDLPYGKIHECQLYLCARSYTNATVRRGILDVSNAMQYSLMSTGSWYNPVSDSAEAILSVVAEPGGYDFNDTFTINGADWQSTSVFLQSLFTTDQWTLAGPNSIAAGDVTIGYALQMAPDIPSAIQNVASSITQLFKSGPNSTAVYGTTIETVPFIHVRWAWLILPGGLVVCGLVLLIALICSTRKRNIALWKSSTLALLFHGVPEDQWPRTPAGPATLHSASGMQSMAGNFTVELCNVNDDIRLLHFKPGEAKEKSR